VPFSSEFGFLFSMKFWKKRRRLLEKQPREGSEKLGKL
jgi:hypothetical protein